MKSLVLTKLSEAISSEAALTGSWKFVLQSDFPAEVVATAIGAAPFPPLPGLGWAGSWTQDYDQAENQPFLSWDHSSRSGWLQAGGEVGRALWITHLAPAITPQLNVWLEPCVTFLSQQDWETLTFINTVGSPIPCCSLIFYFQLLVLTTLTTWSQVTLSDYWGCFSPCNQ